MARDQLRPRRNSSLKASDHRGFLMSAPKDRFLRIGEVARRFGVTTDTIRTWVRQGKLRAIRSESGQRRFLEGEVEAALATHKSGLGRGSEANPAVASAERHGGRCAPVMPARRPMCGLDLGIEPDPEVIIARDELETLRLTGEAERLRRSLEAEAAAEATRVAAENQTRQTQNRLENLKSYGRGQAIALPVEWRQCVVVDLERYVMEENLPATLSEDEARAFVRSRVRKTQERFETERDARTAEEAGRARVVWLVRRGAFLAEIKTLGWTSTDSGEFSEAVAETLKASVRPDWNEDRVRRVVEGLFDEWQEDDETEEDEDDEEEDEDDECDGVYDDEDGLDVEDE